MQGAPSTTQLITVRCNASDNAGVAFASQELSETGLGDDGLQWVLLFKAGLNQANDGRSFQFNNADAVIQRSLSAGRDLVVDYDHATDLAPPNGGIAIAAGWITELANRNGELWALIRWNAKALAHIRAREFRYVSPTFQVQGDEEGGVVVSLLRVALTNNPALPHMALASQGAANQPNQPKGTKMELEELIKLLGLPAGSTEADVQAALARAQGLANAACTALDLDEDADADAVKTAIAKASAKEPDPAKYVPAGEVAELAKELNVVKAEMATNQANAAVEEAIKAGKVPPALKSWAIQLATNDPASFKSYLESTPKVIDPDAKSSGGDPATVTLTAAEKEICKNMGLSEDDFLKTRKAEVAAA
ncbi:MAG: phage protease [Magnetovibrionaceae bacterium]